jgi:WD40 repeat protein
LKRNDLYSKEEKFFQDKNKIYSAHLVKQIAYSTDPRDFGQVAKSVPDLKIRLWPMGAPADAEPVYLLRGDTGILWGLSFHPQGHWLASADKTGVALWPLARPYPVVIRRHEKSVQGLVFGPEGRWLASSSMDDTVRLWPLEGDVPVRGRTLLEDPGKQMYDLARTPDGEKILVGTAWSGFRLVSLSGEESQAVPKADSDVYGATISPDGRFGAGALDVGTPEARILVWDLASGEELVNLRPRGRRVGGIQFTDDGHVLSASESGLLRWNVETRERELLYEGCVLLFAASAKERRVLMIECENAADSWGRVLLLEPDSGAVTHLDRFGDKVSFVALDPTGSIAFTGDRNGDVRVEPLTGGEPHLLLGHEHAINVLAIDPLGRWIASGGDDNTVRLWPMPDLSKPPLHTLPREELIAKLKTLTNLRVVRDEDAPTGWKLEVGPFPGWETVPTW